MDQQALRYLPESAVCLLDQSDQTLKICLPICSGFIDTFPIIKQDFDREREKMLQTCNQYHSMNFARAELKKGDEMIKEADRLLAEEMRRERTSGKAR